MRTNKTPSRHLPDTLHVLSRRLRCTFKTVSVSQSQIALCTLHYAHCTFQTPYMYFPDTLDVLSRQSQSLSLKFNYAHCTMRIAPSTHLTCSFQTHSIISRQHSNTTQHLPEPKLAKPVQFRPSRHLPGTFQTRFRHLPDTLQTPFRHLQFPLEK